MNIIDCFSMISIIETKGRAILIVFSAHMVKVSIQKGPLFTTKAKAY